MSNPIATAQNRIALILRDLEAECGVWVEAVEIDSVDVTQIQDARQMLIKSVRIAVRTPPGIDWQTTTP